MLGDRSARKHVEPAPHALERSVPHEAGEIDAGHVEALCLGRTDEAAFPDISQEFGDAMFHILDIDFFLFSFKHGPEKKLRRSRRSANAIAYMSDNVLTGALDFC
jgi:hypothetical protein